jgi:hypothetical protein
MGGNKMKAANFKKALSNAKHHAKVMIRGFVRTIYCALVSSLIAFAVYGFLSVAKESGWTAVCDFIASCATMVVALANVYIMGNKKKGAKHGRT